MLVQPIRLTKSDIIETTKRDYRLIHRIRSCFFVVYFFSLMYKKRGVVNEDCLLCPSRDLCPSVQRGESRRRIEKVNTWIHLPGQIHESLSWENMRS